MSEPSREDLAPILDTLREVRESLDRRAARAAAVNNVAWGLVAAGIFLFYAWVDFNRGSVAVRALDEAGLLPWMWVPPLALGYVATLATGVRWGRMAPDSDAARGTRWLLLALLVPVAGLLVVSSTGGKGANLIPSMWLVFLGVAHLARGWRCAGPLTRVAAVASFVLAVPLALLPMGWAFLGGAAWYLLALSGLAAWHHHRG